MLIGVYRLEGRKRLKAGTKEVGLAGVWVLCFVLNTDVQDRGLFHRNELCKRLIPVEA